MRSVSCETGATLLAVGSVGDDLLCLRTICASAGWTLREAQTVAGGLACSEDGPIPVVLCEEHPPGGRWEELLDAVARLPEPPLLIVWSRHADCQLWGEVLNLGGFDVLATPFDTEEVVRSVGGAMRSWEGQRGRITNPAVAA